MKINKKLFEVPIGDWSDDGHGECESYYILANYPVESMQEAYKETCKKIGLQMNSGKDYTGENPENGWSSNWRILLAEYEECSISDKAVDILLEHGYDFEHADLNGGESDGDREAYFGEEGVFHLFMWFISYSMPEDFEWEQTVIDATPINGYWGDLNHQIGYGVFY